MEADILRTLFAGEEAQANYNDWGCPNTHGEAGIQCSAAVWSASELRNKRVVDPVPAGYQGGHAGWDAQTLSVAGSATANERFYAVSPGVIKRNGSPTFNLIAVWHEPSNTTTIYLHARSLNPDLRVGSPVQVGTWLGIQGDRGSTGAEHVHIEVRAGEQELGSGGADQSLQGPSCNPVEFLWRSVRGWSTAGHTCGQQASESGEGRRRPHGEEVPTSTTSSDNGGTPPPPALVSINGTRIVEGSLIKRAGSGEIYVVKLVGDQRHKRLFIRYEQLAIYGHLPNAPQLEVSKAVFDSLTTSCIVEVQQGQSTGFWHLGAQEGLDIGASHRIDATRAQLMATGISDAAVFVIDGRELRYFQAGPNWSASQAAAATCGR